MKASSRKKPKTPPVPKPKRKKAALAIPDRVPLAQLKVNFSRFVREVQMSGRTITITQHGRDAAVLAPVQGVEARPALTIRPRLDRRPLGEIIKGLKGLPKGHGVSNEDIQAALDWTRADRF